MTKILKKLELKNYISLSLYLSDTCKIMWDMNGFTTCMPILSIILSMLNHLDWLGLPFLGPYIICANNGRVCSGVTAHFTPELSLFS